MSDYRPPEHNELPGRPRGQLVRKVRRTLYSYTRCRPLRTDRAWRLAWEWADACTRDGERFITMKRRPWPSPSEIASQYLLIVLAEMKSSHQLRLPFRAQRCIPAQLAELLAENGPLTMLAHDALALPAPGGGA